MAYHHKIAEEAHQAYRADRMAEAVLLFRRAASAALEFNDRTAWFKNTVWAAHAASQKGDVQTSLALLLEARQSEPEEALNEAWIARKQLLFITIATRPERSRLDQLREDLRSYATTHHVPAGDLLEIEGVVFQRCGDWGTALARFEAAWQAYDGRGFLKAGKAYFAAYCSLRLGQFAPCRDWIAAFDREENYLFVNRENAEVVLRLALAEGQPFGTLLSHLRTYNDRSAGHQRDEVVDGVREFTARIHLLDPYAGDPAADFHPSRGELRRPLKERQDVHSRYDAHLLHLDYRLACLRYEAGVPAVDDFYYYQPQQVPAHLAPADLNQFQRRLHKARAAAGSTLCYARYLDTLLKCDYRQREVQARRERIEEIAQAVGPNPCK